MQVSYFKSITKQKYNYFFMLLLTKLLISSRVKPFICSCGCGEGCNGQTSLRIWQDSNSAIPSLGVAKFSTVFFTSSGASGFGQEHHIRILHVFVPITVLWLEKPFRPSGSASGCRGPPALQGLHLQQVPHGVVLTTQFI